MTKKKKTKIMYTSKVLYISSAKLFFKGIFILAHMCN